MEIIALPIAIASIILYFAPALIASRKENPNANSIFVLNFFTGWTGIGWVICLAWSVSNQHRAKTA